jgi:hypothetical protein
LSGVTIAVAQRIKSLKCWIGDLPKSKPRSTQSVRLFTGEHGDYSSRILGYLTLFMGWDQTAEGAGLRSRDPALQTPNAVGPQDRVPIKVASQLPSGLKG